jgi:molybdopterin molybdotransferase
MLTVEEALQQILSQAKPRPAVAVSRSESLGLVLAEDVTSDVDSPPHDKALVDGYAVVSSDLTNGTATLTVVEEVTAGDVPKQPIASGSATRIMTGAPLPEGADAVVMVEKTEFQPAATPSASNLGKVSIKDGPSRPGQNLMRRATSLQAGQTVLKAGHRIRPIEVGLLAEVGRSEVLAIPRPTVAILSTGNELVPPAQVPSAGQIRNSNGPLLSACVSQLGAVPRDLGIGRDDREELLELIADGLEDDVVILSGGVSAGVLDLVPGVLRELGVEQVFHKVRLKPGKPIWFGVLKSDAGEKLVFGLPGNPVSSFVCLQLFVRPALGRLAGRMDADLPHVAARLTAQFVHRGDRPTYYPAVYQAGDPATIRPLGWQGSADLAGLAHANALIHFPAGDHEFSAGEMAETCLLDHQ